MHLNFVSGVLTLVRIAICLLNVLSVDVVTSGCR